MSHLRCHHENPATLPAQSVRHLRGEGLRRVGESPAVLQHVPRGGFIAYYADSNQIEIYPSHRCFIDGISCYADEARFGGIVIEALPDHPG